MSSVVAICCSDIHLSHTVPVARSVEPDWYIAQKRVLAEISLIQMRYQQELLLVAGDIFDRWNSPAQLINFALSYLPDGIVAIPGQHDLPNHSLDLIQNSAYWSLCLGNKIVDLNQPAHFDQDRKIVVWPFPWGKEVTPIQEDGNLNIALVHAYIWNGKYCYPGAPMESNAIQWMKKLQGYDVAIFGDNHKFFIIPGKPTIINCGTLMRRKIDEIDYKPMIGLIYSDGYVEPHYLETGYDKFIDETKPQNVFIRNREFLDKLKSLGPDSLDFRQALLQGLDVYDTEVRSMVLECLEQAKNG